MLKKRIILGLFCVVITNCLSNKQLEPLIPEAIVAPLLTRAYNPQEQELIKRDLNNIRELCFGGKTAHQNNPRYIATAGGPGACKSTILETFLEGQEDIVYLDPDMRALRFMINTYQQSLTSLIVTRHTSFQDVLVNAYNKWRDGSNYITNTLVNEAYAGHYNIGHGTTSTSPVIDQLYKKLKAANYHITLLLCYGSDQMRINALDHRARTQFFIQASPEDVVNKGKFFPERIPVYVAYADELYFYWTRSHEQGSMLAAYYTKQDGLIIKNQPAFDEFTRQYSKDIADKSLPSLVSLLKDARDKKN